MILGGDIGGTKTNLALYETTPQGKLREVAMRRYPSQTAEHPEDLLTQFLRDIGVRVAAAAFGVAGPVVGTHVVASNLPWVVEGTDLARVLGLPAVTLLNDLEATGHGLPLLEPADFVALNTGTPAPGATQALIAAGTGLGEAVIVHCGQDVVVVPSEGGNSDFAPRNEQEVELWRYLKRSRQFVTPDLIICGSGFRLLHEFLDSSAKHPEFEGDARDCAPQITANAASASCKACVEALHLWVALYGAEAGNLALKVLSRGGMFVAGGIALRILDKMRDGTFREAFCHKSKFRSVLEQIPIHIVMNEKVPVLGAAGVAARAAGLLRS